MLNQFGVVIFSSVDGLIEVILSDFLFPLIKKVSMFHIIRQFAKVSKVVGIKGSMNDVLLFIMILEEG